MDKSTSHVAARAGSGDAPDHDDRIVRLRQLVELLETSSISELEYEDADIKVGLRRGGAPAAAAATIAPVVPIAAPSTVPPPPPTATPPIPEPEDDASVQTICSPFVGTFYRAPAPDAGHYTDVGERVKRGQTVCIVEAMKLMNEIECEVSGTVEAILVENAETVQHGDPLFRIRLG